MESHAIDKQEWSKGWPVALSAALAIGLGLSPLPFYTIGVFVGPMSAPAAEGGLGLSPGQIMQALPIYTFAVLLLSPLIGMLSEKVGVRKVGVASILLFGLAMMSMALNTGSMLHYALTWVAIAVGGAGTLPITFTKPVSNAFVANRGLALGVSLIATGMFGVCAKLLAQQVTAEFGWRAGYVAVGLMPILIALPLALLAFRDVGDKTAEQDGMLKLKPFLTGIALAGTICLSFAALRFALPSIQANGMRLELLAAVVFSLLVLVPALIFFFGKVRPEPIGLDAAGEKPVLLGKTLGEALRDWRFWLLAIAFVPISFALGGPIPNLELILGSKGFDAAEAVGLASLVGLAVIVGRIVGGFLIDRFWAPGVAALFLSVPAIALWILAEPGMDHTMAAVAIFMIGFGAGVEYDFMAYLVARYFGTKAYSAIYGALYGFFAIGAGFGPKIFADAVRGTGGASLAEVLHVAAIALIVFSISLLALGRYRAFEKPAHA
jgi:MFS family permease